MGEALVGGLINGGWAPAGEITVVETDGDRREELAARFPGLVVTDTAGPARGALLAVKPQQVTEVCAGLGRLGITRVLSIAAGVDIATMEGALGADLAVVRAMPNTPSLVGAGASAITGGRHATEDDLTWAEALLGAVGTVTRVTESQLDAVTGLSGSGPAYFFVIAEAMIEAGVHEGLARPVATDLVIQTMRGAAELLATGEAPAVLRAAVTSPGGTTAAGVRALEAAGLRAALGDAVLAAAARSREMG